MLCTDPYVTVDPDLVTARRGARPNRPARRRHPHGPTPTSRRDVPVVDIWNLHGAGVPRVSHESRSSYRPTTRANRSSLPRPHPRTVSTLPCEVLVVYDDPTDTTVAYLEKYAHESHVCFPSSTVRAGAGSGHPYGIEHARAPVAVVTMADGSDDPEQIDELSELVERGVVVAAASRYMSGGQQIGGPVVKSSLSRLAGMSLYWLGAGRHPRRDELVQGVLDRLRPRGRHRVRRRLRDRHRARGQGPAAPAAGGRDPHDLARTRAWAVQLQGHAWIPRYLRWYRFAFGPALTQDRSPCSANRATRP